MRVLVTGGAGYIGSHATLLLLEAGHEVHVMDNFSNSSPESLRRVQSIANRELTLHTVDLLDRAGVDEIVAAIRPEAVMHFAGLKSVSESVVQPIRYYEQNITGTLNLLGAISESTVSSFVFSSSATVYGGSSKLPVGEDAPLAATSPYGRTKLFIEEILNDFSLAQGPVGIAILRYFNPVGAHASGLIGEDPKGVPNNLVPYIAQVAVGRRDVLQVFGDDYATVDGTGVRDYIHVMDLAAGHLAALEFLSRNVGCHRWNLGSGQGSSVYEVLDTFSEVVGREIPTQVVSRRPGDVAESYADPTRARLELGWQTTFDLREMVEDAWRWQVGNPEGYEGFR